MKKDEKKEIKKPEVKSIQRPGTISNSIIQKRNGGIKHQFEDSIGGDSSNYR
jgi:hypothetical protein